ncbi:MAG TPA: hypothetical protein PLL10_06480 [Elusimicrobiales bacterium]|nr:hypothetical protein [Elusimicrobiales bacterium]
MKSVVSLFAGIVFLAAPVWAEEQASALISKAAAAQEPAPQAEMSTPDFICAFTISPVPEQKELISGKQGGWYRAFSAQAYVAENGANADFSVKLGGMAFLFLPAEDGNVYVSLSRQPSVEQAVSALKGLVKPGQPLGGLRLSRDKYTIVPPPSWRSESDTVGDLQVRKDEQGRLTFVLHPMKGGKYVRAYVYGVMDQEITSQVPEPDAKAGFLILP